MKKTEFIDMLAKRADVSKKEATAMLAAFDEIMLEEIFAKEDSVKLGIGTFSGFTKETKARTARNPKTGEAIQVPAKKIKGYPKFKPSKAAKE